MAFNGSGVFQRLYSWVNDAAANIKIRADRMDNEMNGFATGLSTCITKDGQTTITANLPMANFRHTGVGNAASRTDYAAFGQVQDGKAAWVDGGGTADAITAAYSIPITALVDGQLCYVRATAANATTTPTFSPNGLTARTIVKNGGQALVAGDISGDGHELELRYDLANTRWELLNPKISVTLAGSETLSNKTLTSPVLNGTVTGTAVGVVANNLLKLNASAQIPILPALGVTDGSSAAAGVIGEVIKSDIVVGSAVSLVTATAKNVTSLTLTAGSWRISGNILFTGAATTTVSSLIGALSTVTNSISPIDGGCVVCAGNTLNPLFNSVPTSPAIPLPGTVVNISGSTTYYLVAQLAFAVSTASAYGQIIATRIR
jgi:hypothetical protein